MIKAAHHSPNARENSPQQLALSLTQWICQIIDIPQLQVRSRLRGNDLHILLEGQDCPQVELMPRLIEAVTPATLLPFLPANLSQLYRVIVYGRATNASTPAWTRSFYLNPPAAQSQAEVERSQPQASDAPATRNAAQVECGAIAHTLSDALSSFGVAIRVKLVPSQSDDKASLPRLVIRCESAYSPDPQLLAEPIAQQLRSLKLQGLQDALVFAQVSGEATPEWTLRVDLTPPEQILRDWARWGDVQAIARLLNHSLKSQKLQVTALLKEVTLHLTCSGVATGNAAQGETVGAIAPILESLSPQGISAVTIYGVTQATRTASPLWVHWLNLAPADTSSTLALAQQGDEAAIAFLLTRLLNPNLDAMLAKGGIRVQLTRKGDLLHVMTDGLTCPPQHPVGSAVGRLLQPLQMPEIAGVRVYGRRAGQKQPLWSYGVDFLPRQRLVPEATPEFAASDAYVGDLLAPPGALVVRSQQESAEDWRSLLQIGWESGIQTVQRSLIASQLFAPVDAVSFTPTKVPADAQPSQRGKVAIVWATAGLLLAVQADWLLGRVVPTPVATPTAPAIAPVATPAAPVLLPNVSLKKSEPDTTAFSSTGFTRSGAQTPLPLTDLPLPSDLPASPLQPKATTIAPHNPDVYPTFNVRQLDERLTLYRHYVAQHGVPDVLIVGSSRALRGVDPTALQTFLIEQKYPGVKVFNFGINGATVQLVDLLVRQMLPQETLPKLIVFADGSRAFNGGRVDVTHNAIAVSPGYQRLMAGQSPIPGTIVTRPTQPDLAQTAKPGITEVAPTAATTNRYQIANRKLDEWLGAISLSYGQRDRLKTALRDQMAAVLPKLPGVTAEGAIALNKLGNSTTPAASAASTATPVFDGQGQIDSQGFFPLPNRFNPATYYQKYARVSGDYDMDYEGFSLDGKQTAALTSLTQFTQARQIALVVVNLPLTRDYLDPVRSRYEEAFQSRMSQLSTQLGFTYRDLSQALVAQPDYFSDPSHLNRYGGYEVARRLAQDVLIPWNKTR
jgi:hypothetical protein